MTPDFVAAIETRFRDGMVAEYGSDFPLYYSNVPVPEGVEDFAVVHVINDNETRPINLGGEAKSRVVGIVQIDVFTPKDTGAGKGKRIAQVAGRIFHRQKFHVTSEGHVTMGDLYIEDRGEVRGRHKEMCSIPYRYDFSAVV